MSLTPEQQAEIEAQRAELDTVIDELKGQLTWGREVLASLRQTAA